MSKMDTHGTAPYYSRESRSKRAVLARAEKLAERVRARRGPRAQPTRLRHCPWCGHGLSSRYRKPGTHHLRRNALKGTVCGWTP